MFLDTKTPFRSKKSHHRDHGREHDMSDQYAIAGRHGQLCGQEYLQLSGDPRDGMLEGGRILTPSLRMCTGRGRGAPIIREPQLYGPPSALPSREPLLGVGERSHGSIRSKVPDIGFRKFEKQHQGTRGARSVLDAAAMYGHLGGMPGMSAIQDPGRQAGIGLEDSLQAMSLEDPKFQYLPFPGSPGYHVPEYPPPPRQLPISANHNPRPTTHRRRSAESHCITHCRGHHGNESQGHDCHAHMNTNPRRSPLSHHHSGSKSGQRQAADEMGKYQRRAVYYQRPSAEEYYHPANNNRGPWGSPIMGQSSGGAGYWYEDVLYIPYAG